MTPTQCRAARALLNLSQIDLAEAADVVPTTLGAFERGERKAYPKTLEALRAQFEARGVRFTPNGVEAVLATPRPLPPKKNAMRVEVTTSPVEFHPPAPASTERERESRRGLDRLAAQIAKVDWSDIECLLIAAGARVIERNDTTVWFEKDGKRESFHVPTPEAKAHHYQVLEARLFLERSDSGREGQPPRLVADNDI